MAKSKKSLLSLVEVQLTKPEKSGGNTAFGNTFYFSHTAFEGTGYTKY